MRSWFAFFTLPLAVLGHYSFCFLSTDNGTTWSKPYEYVRNLTYEITDTSLYPNAHTSYDPPGYVWYYYPVIPGDPSQDFLCGRGSQLYGPRTKIAKVTAGSVVSFGLACDAYSSMQCSTYHEGSYAAYLSKAPGDIRQYDGNGDWFKVWELGLNISVPENQPPVWLGQFQYHYNITIPPTTPPGQYLLRMEQIYPWNVANQTQFYSECAQIEVSGPGGGNPSPLVRIPDTYNFSGPGIIVSDAMFGLKARDPGYEIPGPEVWTG